MRLQYKAFELFADSKLFYQFGLWDRGKSPEAAVDDTAEDAERRIGTKGHMFIIQSTPNQALVVKVEVHDTEPAYHPEQWCPIAEASLHLPTGQLQIDEYDRGARVDFRVEPGWYRVRWFHGGFSLIAESGEEGTNHFLAALWPAPPGEEFKFLLKKEWKPEEWTPEEPF